jgi:hypothetical protein
MGSALEIDVSQRQGPGHTPIAAVGKDPADVILVAEEFYDLLQPIRIVVRQVDEIRSAVRSDDDLRIRGVFYSATPAQNAVATSWSVFFAFAWLTSV